MNQEVSQRDSKASLYFNAGSYELVCNSDADWDGDINTRRSISGHLVTFAWGVVS